MYELMHPMNNSVACRNNLTTELKLVLFCQLFVSYKMFLPFFQIHGNPRRHNESPSVWYTVHDPNTIVF